MASKIVGIKLFWSKNWIIFLYFLAIVLPNVITAWLGVYASYINSVLFIGFDLTARDTLHDRWQQHLFRNMSILILSGSLVAFVVSMLLGFNHLVPIASAVSFMVSSFADTVVYSVLYKKKYLVKSNGSNLVSTAVDSVVFPTIAFGGLNWQISITQFFLKFIGGFLWTLVLNKKAKNV